MKSLIIPTDMVFTLFIRPSKALLVLDVEPKMSPLLQLPQQIIRRIPSSGSVHQVNIWLSGKVIKETWTHCKLVTVSGFCLASLFSIHKNFIPGSFSFIRFLSNQTG